MAATRKPAALVAAEKRIAELEKKLSDVESSKDTWYKQAQEKEAIIEGIHEVLDDLGIKGYKGDNQYYRLPLAVRLFSWAMKLANRE
jgi:16S rRNA C1402 N4-methylase RsmH